MLGLEKLSARLQAQKPAEELFETVKVHHQRQLEELLQVVAKQTCGGFTPKIHQESKCKGHICFFSEY